MTACSCRLCLCSTSLAWFALLGAGVYNSSSPFSPLLSPPPLPRFFVAKLLDRLSKGIREAPTKAVMNELAKESGDAPDAAYGEAEGGAGVVGGVAKIGTEKGGFMCAGPVETSHHQAGLTLMFE